MSATAAFALLLFGCADDGTACERIAAPASYHETRAECRQAEDLALVSSEAMNADYPSVFSQCLGSREVSMIEGKRNIDLAMFQRVRSGASFAR